MSAATVRFADIDAAAQRISGLVRVTPTIKVGAGGEAVAPGGELILKLDCLQPSGSFKIRGASNTVASLSAAQLQRGLITASGGNHGMAVAYAASRQGAPAVIYLPTSTPARKVAQLAKLGADVVVEGAVWDDANAAALARAAAAGLSYVHPFADPRVIAGQGTAALEFLAQAPDLDVLLISIGGGGLIAGAALAAKSIRPQMRVIGIEPEGAATLFESRRAGHPVQLTSITTTAGSLAPRQSTATNFELIEAHVDDIILVTDADMKAAACWLWDELGIAAEMAAAAGIAALQRGLIKDLQGASIGVLVCGAGIDGLSPAGQD